LSKRLTAQHEMMLTRIQDGTMMIREGLLSTDLAHIESLRYSDTWRMVPRMDSFALDRKLRAVGLHLLFIAGESKVTELGWGKSAIRRGIKRILAKGRKRGLNCMEITQVRTTHFLGLPSTAVWAHSFHVQNNTVLESEAARKIGGKINDWACG
jgi:hypothetical protein